MRVRALIVAAVPAVLFAIAAGAQHPILDIAANKVVEKYRHSSCEQLWEQRRAPKPPEERQLVEMLRTDAQLRTEFIDRIAAPVANKMFECGLIP